LRAIFHSLYSAEDRFLLACVRGPEPLKAIAPPGFDWPAFGRTAIESRVAALVYFRLKAASGLDRIPEGTRRFLEERILASTVHGMKLQALLQRVVECFGGRGIPVVLLKGAAMRHVYQHPALRLVGDLDLLVHRDDVAAAVAALGELGLKMEQGETPNEHHHAPGMYTQDGLIVEIHWNIVPPRLSSSIPPADLWEHTSPVKVGDGKALIFDPAMMLLHGCLHATGGHAFEQMLYQLCDLAEIARRFSSSMDWDDLVRTAHRYRVAWMVSLSLEAAVKIAGAEIPADVLAQLRAGTKHCFLRRAVINGLMPRLALRCERAMGLPCYVIAGTVAPLVETEGEMRAWANAFGFLLRQGGRTLVNRIRGAVPRR
jgi:hypothetical protein